MKSVILVLAICISTAGYAQGWNNTLQPEGCSDPEMADCHHDDPGHGNKDGYGNGDHFGNGSGDFGNGGGYNNTPSYITCVARDSHHRQFSATGLYGRSTRETARRALYACQVRSYLPSTCQLTTCFYAH